MAHVKSAARDRGQLFLVGALTLAVLFVSLALLLNTAIYTENLGTRSADPGTASAITHRNAAIAGTTGIVTRANAANNTDYGTLHGNVTGDVGHWSEAAATHSAYRGRVARVDVTSTNNGTLIRQTDGARNFTDKSGSSADWELVSGASQVRDVRMNVSRSDLADTGPVGVLGLSDIYVMNVTDAAGTTFEVAVAQNSLANEVNVTVTDPTGSIVGTCTAPEGPSGHVVVDVTNASVGGESCGELRFFGNFTGDLTVTYHSPDEAVGTYQLVVDRDEGLVDSGQYHDEDVTLESPHAIEAIYAIEIEISYESDDISYRATRRIAPGEPSS